MYLQYLTIAGLALDFAGFCLLLREWWIAFFSENARIEADERLDRTHALRALGRSHASATGTPQSNPYAAIERMQDEQASRASRSALRASLTARRGVFVLASVLIVLGFLLQLAGAWPV